MKTPKIVVILLNYNSDSHTLECVASLRHVLSPAFEGVIIDNHSAEVSFQFLQKSISDWTLIRTEENLGYAGGINVGIRHALKMGADNLLLLNNDAVVEPDFLTPLVKRAESDPNIGIVGSKVVDYYKRDFIQAAGTRVPWGLGSFNIEGSADDPSLNIVKSFPALTGCVWLVRASVFEKVGFLNEDYFLYAEDVEFCWRVQKKFKIIYEPSSVVYHKDGGSSPNAKARGKVVYYCTRNKCYFMRSKGLLEFSFFFLHYFVGRSAKALLWFCKGDYWKTWGVYRGFVDFFCGKTGPLFNKGGRF